MPPAQLPPARFLYFWSTLSRNSLPALKCGTNFSGTCTRSPDFGLRPTRAGRGHPKLPKPRISMRCPFTEALRHRIQIILTVNWILGHELRIARSELAINSDLVMPRPRLLFERSCCPASPQRAPRFVLPCWRRFALELGHRFVLVGQVLCLTERLMVRFLRSTLMIIA